MFENDLVATIVLVAYYLVGLLAIPTMLKAWSPLPREVIRKIQHVAYSLSVFILLRLFSTWYMAVLAAFCLVLFGLSGALPIGKTELYKKYFVDRTEREESCANSYFMCRSLSPF